MLRNVLFLIGAAWLMFGSACASDSYEFYYETNGGEYLDYDVTPPRDWDGTLPVPQRVGYVFIGWYFDEELTEPFSEAEFHARGERVVSLYAAWEVAEVEIVVERYRESPLGVYELYATETVGGIVGEQVIPPTRHYDGFHQDVLHPDRVPSIIASETDNGPIRLYYARNTHLLRFMTEGGSRIEPLTFRFEQPIVLPEDPVRPGYEFVGWFYTVITETPYSPRSMPDNDMALYAKWTPAAAVVAVEHYLENAEGGYDLFETTEVEGTYFAVATATANVYEHYVLDADHPEARASGTATVDPELVLKFYYERQTYALRYEENGGEEIPDTLFKWGTMTVPPEPPVRAGWIFAGWFADAILDEPQVWSPMGTADATVYAKWEPHFVTIAFETNGAEAIAPQVAQEGTAYTLPSPEWADHVFGGWYEDAGLTVRHIIDGSFPSADLTLHALWYGQTYMIHFDTMGGDYVEDLFLPAGSPLVLPTPEFPGFIFVGWYDASLVNPFTLTTMPEANLVLYAKWTPA